MLRARSGARYRQCRAQAHQAAGEAGERVAAGGQRGADRENDAPVHPLDEPAGGKLERRHRAGVKPAQRGQHPVAQAEFGLPERQQDVDQVGVSVVQRMRGSGDRERAPGGCDVRGGRAGAAVSRCSTLSSPVITTPRPSRVSPPRPGRARRRSEPPGSSAPARDTPVRLRGRPSPRCRAPMRVRPLANDEI